MKTLLIFLFSVLSVFAADPAQPKVGPTPVLNARNGFGGILTIRTQINVGYTGQAGFIEMRSDEPTNYGAIYLSPSNWVFSVNATDEYDGGAFTLVVTNEIQQADILQMYNGTNLKVYIQYDGSILGHRLFAEDAPFSDNYTRIQPTNTKINIGVNTNYISFDAATGIIEMFHEGTNTFRVNQNSGYNGQADWFLAADGDYHQSSGGGGDSLWTNNAGTVELIQPVTGEADGQPILVIDTSIAHTSGNLVEVKNNGEAAVGISYLGGLSLGKSSEFYWGSSVGNNVIDWQSVERGDPASQTWLIENTVDNAETAYGTLVITSSTNSITTVGTTKASGSVNNFTLESTVGGDTVISLTVAGNLVTSLRPTQADGSSGYVFDYSTTHASGNLAEFKNNGTNKMELSYKGFLTLTDVGGNTAGIGMNASGQMILQASDGSGATITGNQMVPLGGVTMSLGSANASTKWTDLALSQDLYVYRHIVWNGTTNSVWDLAGSFADPNGNVPACSPGSTYRYFGGGAGATFWVKESGTATQTGWVAK